MAARSGVNTQISKSVKSFDETKGNVDYARPAVGSLPSRNEADGRGMDFLARIHMLTFLMWGRKYVWEFIRKERTDKGQILPNINQGF